MVGYYSQREHGEMAYSVAARTVSLLFPGRSAKYAAEYLLGSPHYTIGGLLPNNGRLLQKHIPPIAALTDDVLVDGSTYHLMAPFLPNTQRLELKQSIFEENARGRRGVIRRPGRLGVPLQYCVPCAQRDFRAGRPQVWRVVPNFPGVNCCHEHGCLLVTTEALLEPGNIHDPGEWIDPEVPVPPSACNGDQRFAEDVQWVFERKSVDLPGYQRLGAALRKVLMKNPRYLGAKEKLSAQSIATDLCATMMATVMRLDPALLGSTWKPVLSTDVCYPLARYSLLAQLAGLTLKDVFELARKEPEVPADEGADPEAEKSARVANAQQRLAELVAGNPSLGRKQIIALDPSAADILRRNDPAAFETVMPARIRRGRNSCFNWAARDQEVHATILKMAPSLGEDAQSAARILRHCGFSVKLFEKARGRLPWAKLLVSATIDSWHCKRAEQTYFPFF